MHTLALRAKEYAFKVHSKQRRKYTDAPYFEHLAEVAGLVSTVSNDHPNAQVTLATAWLHDSIEDQAAQYHELASLFGESVAAGVLLLSDLEQGTRAERKAASRQRLATAPAWIQDIKVADIISNTSTIAIHDPKFAKVYLKEKQLLLDVLTLANPSLLTIARSHINPPTTSNIEAIK